MFRRSSCLASFALLSLALTACDARNPPIPETWVDPPIATQQKASTLPAATHEGATPEGSLLASYAERTPRSEAELEGWMLPFQSKTMVVELLIAAAKDDPERMGSLLTDNARWGTPDRRELRAQPISTKADPLGREFLESFRAATSRFGKKATFGCTPLQPGWETFAAAGAEPVWCSYTSSDSLDILGFRLIMERGQLKTDYVGFFRERQDSAIRVPNAGDPPPLTPFVKRPVELALPDLMPDGSNPVIEKRRPARQPTPEPQPVKVVNDADAPIPVPARPEPPAPSADE